MSKQGYILIHRKIFENSLYFAEVFSKMQAWIDLLLLANHSSRKIDIRGNYITVNRGQVAWSEESLAERWKWSRGKVRRFFDVLVAEGMIVHQKTPAIILKSIVNYDVYQSNKTTDRTSVGTADGTETNNERININSTAIVKHEVDDKEKSQSCNYHAVLDCWKEERDRVGLFTGLISENSKVGAVILASAIDKNEITLADVKKATQNLLADTEKREKYTLKGLANNFELWLNCSQTHKNKTIQFNQANDIVYYFGICEQCGYSMTSFNEELTTCQKCKNQITLRKEDNGS